MTSPDATPYFQKVGMIYVHEFASQCSPPSGRRSSNSSSTSSSTSSSSAQNDGKQQQADVLSALLVDIKGNVEVGSAGSSLKAVPYAAALLNWASSSTLSQEEIDVIVSEMLNTVSGDESAAAEYAAQLGLVNADCQVLLSDDAEELLNEAGCADVNTDWPEQTAGVLGLVMAAAGVEN